MPDETTLCKPKIKHSNKPWPAERVERLRVLFAAGPDYRAIGAELDCSKNAVSGKLARLGLDRQPEFPTFEQRVGWEQVIAKGCRWVEGDPRGEWHWCGVPQEPHESYCHEHRLRAWQKATH
jgi:hypothetical protein